MNPLVQHLQVTNQFRFDPRGNPYPVIQYSYFIGQHGPFTDSFPRGEDTLAAVQAAMQVNIDKLNALGALPATPVY